MKVVLDANVLISAAIANGASNRIVLAWLDYEPFNSCSVLGSSTKFPKSSRHAPDSGNGFSRMRLRPMSSIW